MKITEQMIKENPLYWISTANGGYSRNQRQKDNGSVVPNCTGNATGMFLLYIKLTTGVFREDIRNALIYDGGNYWWQVTNPNGQLYGKLEYGQKPREGAIMCFSGGSSGCGHVCFVNEVINDNDTWCWTSAYKGAHDHEYEHNTNNNGNWSYVKSLKFQGFIYPPNSKPEPPKPVEPKVGDIVQFKGGEYHSNSGGGYTKIGTPCRAKLTRIYENTYPYLVINEDTSKPECVYGWVKKDQVELIQDTEFFDYTMKSGDRLWDIATKYYGNGSYYTVLMEDNNINDQYTIPTGKVIKIRKNFRG